MKRKNLTLSYDSSLIAYLSDVGTDVRNGARPLERLIKRKVLAPISAKSLDLNKTTQSYNIHVWVEGEAPDGSHRVDQRQLHFDVTEPLEVLIRRKKYFFYSDLSLYSENFHYLLH